MSWPASTDNVGVTGYQLERCQGVGCTAFVRSPPRPRPVTGTAVLPPAPVTVIGSGPKMRRAISAPIRPSPRRPRRPAPGDNFNRANALDLGPSWDAGYTDQLGANTNLQIVGNRVRATTASRDATETYTGVALANNQWAQLTLATATGTPVMAPRLLLRFSAPGTKSGYEFALGRGASALPRALGDGMRACLRQLAAENATAWVAGDVLRAEVEGTTLRLYRNNVLVLSRRTPPSRVAGRGSRSMPPRWPMSNWMTLAQGISKLDAYDIVERPANLRSQSWTGTGWSDGDD